MIVEQAWPMIDRDGFIDSGIPDAFEWHNFARSGRELHYLDIQLAHHWISLEVLAARWGKRSGASKLLKGPQFTGARACVREYAATIELDEADAAALDAKVSELARRPMKAVVLAYLRQLFEPYPAQPIGDDLEKLVGACIKWRNDMVHVGSLAMHKMPRENGVPGFDRVLQAVRQLEALVARALLAEIEAPIPLLAEVPWTDWRSPR